MPDVSGVISAMLTPFVSDVGPVDYEAVPPYLRFLEDKGMHGVVVLGTTGEGQSLGMNERELMLEAVLEARGNLAVVACTGCTSLTETILLSRYAVEQGADALLVMPPYYIKGPSDAGVLNYFRALCDALPAEARVLLYHIPQVTSVPITPAIIEGLLQSHPTQFYGMKDSSGNTDHALGLIKTYPQLRIFTGSDHLVATSLRSGGAGAISALSSAFPHLIRAVYDAHQSGGDVDADQARLSAVRRLLDPVNTPPALKAALPWTSGLPESSVRLPLVSFSDAEAAQLKAEVERVLG